MSYCKRAWKKADLELDEDTAAFLDTYCPGDYVEGFDINIMPPKDEPTVYNRWLQAFKDRADSFWQSFKTYAKSITEGAIKWAKEHPILSAIAIVTMTLTTVMAFVRMSYKAVTISPPQMRWCVTEENLLSMFNLWGPEEYNEQLGFLFTNNVNANLKNFHEEWCMDEDPSQLFNVPRNFKGTIKGASKTNLRPMGSQDKGKKTHIIKLRACSSEKGRKGKTLRILGKVDVPTGICQKFFNSLPKTVQEGFVFHLQHVDVSDVDYFTTIDFDGKTFTLQSEDGTVYQIDTSIVSNIPDVFTVSPKGDQESDNVMRKALTNIYGLYRRKDGVDKYVGNCMFVKGTYILMPYHFTLIINNSSADVLVLKNKYNETGIEFPVSAINNHKRITTDGFEKDAVLFDAGRSVANHKDLLKCWILRAEQGKVHNSPATTVAKLGASADTLEFVIKHGLVKALNDWRKTCPYQGEDLQYAGIYQMQFEALDGDCGAPLILKNNRVSGKICAMLALGDENNSLFVPLCREDITRTLDAFPDSISKISHSDIKNVVPKASLPLPVGNFIPLGEVVEALPTAQKSGKTKSLVYGQIHKVEGRPSQLRRFDDWDPVHKGLEKCGKPVVHIPDDLVEMAARDVEQMLMANHREDKPPSSYNFVLSYEEAVCGTEDEFIRPVKRSTSAGYPWVLRKPAHKPGKSHWLGEDNNWNFDTPQGKELRESVEFVVSEARERRRVGIIFTDTGKDEILDNEKIDFYGPGRGKVRVFSAGPMEYTIAARQYFLPFVAYMMHNRIVNQSGVGINPFGPDWEILYHKLQSKGSNLIAGDFSNYDGTLSAQILWAICGIVNNFHNDNEDNKRVRETLFSEIAHGIHLHHKSVYQWHRSLPSGNPFTSVFNTIYNLISMRVVWLMQTKRPLIEFNRHVYMVAYGDDNALNISDEAAKFFDQKVISDGYVKIGMTYTDEEKKGISEMRGIGDISFLKRSFKYDTTHGQVIGPLAPKSIFKSINWISKTSDPITATAENVSGALKEISLHGRDYFDHWYPIIMSNLTSDMKTSAVFGHTFEDYVLLYKSGVMAETCPYW
jgi:hypothetical protein